MLDSVRARLTLWYTAILALVLIVFAVTAYFFLARILQQRTDDALAEMASAFSETVAAEDRERPANGPDGNPAATSAPAAGGADDDAVIEAVNEFRLRDYQFIVYDRSRRIVAASADPAHPESKATVAPFLPPVPGLLDSFPRSYSESGAYASFAGHPGEVRAFARTVSKNNYLLVVIRPVREQKAILERVRVALWIGIPVALLLASLGGYFLARKSLAPVTSMSEMAARMGAANLHERLPVVNESDELGRLAQVFNQLLGRLGDSFEQQRRFMADASHELRTPVAIVRGEAEVALSRAERDAEDYRESLSIVHDEGRRLTYIVEDLFTLARADAGQHAIRREGFYLDETVVDSVRAMRTLAASKGVAVEHAKMQELPFRGDEELIRRMLVNLLDNAIKYTPAGGHITVNCETQGETYVLTVSDTGAGIPRSAQPHIFERFYRADAARSRAENADGTRATTSGAGLGLSIARLAAESHAGRLELLHSDEHGSVFVATLPLPST
jgi:heavy metal sensor kinase